MKTTRVYRVCTLKTYWQLVWVCCMALLGVMPMGCGSGVDDDWEFHDPEVEYYTDDGSDEGLTPSVEDLEKAAATTYYLPFHSGETFRADTYSGHNAWDFNKGSGSDDCGEPVVAVTNGIIKTAVANRDTATTGEGNYVVLDHDVDTNFSHYYHLTQVFVRAGQWVERGQTLGTIGDTGNSSACHLHYEVRTSSNTPSSAITTSLQFYYNGGQSKLTSGKSYTSTNAGKMDGAFSRNGGSAKMGSASPAHASRVAYDGYVKYYNGGSYGECAIYYEALGCGGGDFCPSYNNSNFAWLVRTGFYNYYRYTCGGPQTCWLGFPTGDEVSVSGGAKQTFEYGYLLFTSSNGQVTAYRY